MVKCNYNFSGNCIANFKLPIKLANNTQDITNAVSLAAEAVGDFFPGGMWEGKKEKYHCYCSDAGVPLGS